eukprot:6218876-Pyramimonas_sp.AAC.1
MGAPEWRGGGNGQDEKEDNEKRECVMKGRAEEEKEEDAGLSARRTGEKYMQTKRWLSGGRGRAAAAGVPAPPGQSRSGRRCSSPTTSRRSRTSRARRRPRRPAATSRRRRTRTAWARSWRTRTTTRRMTGSRRLRPHPSRTWARTWARRSSTRWRSPRWRGSQPARGAQARRGSSRS